MDGVALDPTAGRIYWGNASGHEISFANLNGTGGGDLNIDKTKVSGPTGVALDPTTGTVYWTSYVKHEIWFAHLDGTGITKVSPGPAYGDGPEYLAVLEVPRSVAAPAVTGGSVVAAQLACSIGTWRGDLSASFVYRAPRSFAYQWTRNGANIPAATKSSYTATLAGRYRCRVSATNAAGTATRTSAAHNVFAKAKITKVAIDAAKHRARFSFKSKGGGIGFRCALVKSKTGAKPPKPSFSACTSPKTYKNVTPGHYTFEVRVLSAGSAGPPAKKSFAI